MKQKAKEYINQGYSVIITNGKVPAIESWKEYQQRIVSEETMDMWWDKNPSGNIAIVTGKISGLTVIDVDGELGQESLKKFKINLPPTKINKTPKGWHYIYEYNEEYPQGVGILPGIDIRNNGGYIIAPPSEINGLFYEEVVNTAPAKLPPVETIFNGHSPKKEQQAPNPQWVEELLKNGSGEGRRNQDATRLAGHYRTKNLGSLETFEILKMFADRCVPKMDHNELWNTIQSIFRYAGNIENAKITEAPEIVERGDALIYSWQQYGLVITLDQIIREKNDLMCEMEIEMEYPGSRTLRYGPTRFNLLAPNTKKSHVNTLNSLFRFDWDEVLNIISRLTILRNREGKPFEQLNSDIDEIPPQWLFKPFALENETTILFGDGSMGKSLLSLAVMASIHTGHNVLGITPFKVLKGLYLDWEASAISHKKRLKELSKGHGIDIKKLDIAYQECSSPLAEMASQLAKRISDENIGFVIVDSVAGACGGEPEKAENVIKMFNSIRKLKTTTLLIAHVTKSNDTTKKAFGSTFWHNLARSTVEIKRQQSYGEDIIHIGLFHRKNNYGRLEHPLGFRIDFGNEKVMFEYQDPYQMEEIHQEMPTKDRIMAALYEGDLTYQEIADATGLKPGTVKATVKRHPQAFATTGGGLGKGNENKVSLRNKGFKTIQQNDTTKTIHKTIQNDTEIEISEIPFDLKD